MDIIIETPRDSRAKYKYNKKDGNFILKNLLPLGMVFPYAFGFIPGTKGEDGDPLDAMVISESVLNMGTVIKCRLVGALKAEQREEQETIRNDRFLFIPDSSVSFAHVTDISQMGEEHNEQLSQFFINYNKVFGKFFTPLEWIDSTAAKKLLDK